MQNFRPKKSTRNFINFAKKTEKLPNLNFVFVKCKQCIRKRRIQLFQCTKQKNLAKSIKIGAQNFL